MCSSAYRRLRERTHDAVDRLIVRAQVLEARRAVHQADEHVLDGGEGGAVVGGGGRRQEEEEALEEVDAAEHVVEARVRVERLLERLEPHLCRQRPPRLRLRTTYMYM